MAIKTLPNAPLWPPNPSKERAVGPGPQEDKKMKGPPHQDTSPHHSSPTPGDKQTPVEKVLPKNSNKSIKKMPDMPRYKVKHSEPVGRPRNRNYE